MASKRRKAPESPVPQKDSHAGAAFERSTLPPRALQRLTPQARNTLAAVQNLAATLLSLEEHLDRHVVELRQEGASWQVIGWALGVTGEGARKRWGEMAGE